MKLFIEPFTIGSEDETFRKIYEEVYELTEARAFSHAQGDVRTFNVMMEVGDVFTVLTNWCEWVGINPQECIDLANTKNVLRGRYDV